jgi:hypothetical protein
MKVTDIIRTVIDMVDSAEEKSAVQEPEITLVQPEADSELARIMQIAGLLPTDDCTVYANEPQEQYAGIDAVTTLAGGGVNAPKHPHDLRVKDPSQHPMQQGF